MSMSGAIEQKQPQLLSFFSRSMENERLGHAYLFEGSRGTGKKALARLIAQALFCQELQVGKPCGHCRNCQRIEEGNFPDLTELAPDGQSIKVDQIRALKTEFTKSAVEGRRKVYIIEDAEKMTVSAANSLLTFLEEPGHDTYIFLLTTVKENMLPTIRSRCQIIHFQPLKRDIMVELLESEGIAKKDSLVLAAVTNDLGEAKELAEDELFHALKDKVWAWFQLLIAKDSMAILFVQMTLMGLVKEKSHAIFCLDLLLFHYRDLLYVSLHKEEAVIHQGTVPEYQNMAKNSPNPMVITQQIEHILERKQLLNSNVQVQGVLESIAILNQLG